MTELERIKAEVDLRVFALARWGLRVDQSGKGPCPLHPPDKSPSFSIFKGKDGNWRWKCFHEDVGGSIVDLVMRLDGVTEKDAIDRLLAGRRSGAGPKAKPEIIREHVYHDVDGSPVFKKTKYRSNGRADWRLDHYEAGVWKPGKNGREFIPYRLELFKKFDRVIVAEGEKDADTINGLGLEDIFGSSGATGCSSWPDSLTPHFGRFKEAVFLYDIGNEHHAEKHAAKLHAAHPDLSIKIARVPGAQREYDITDYLGDGPAKADALLEVLAAAQPFPPVISPPVKPASAFADLQVENTFLNEFVASVSRATDAPRIFILFSGISLLSSIANKFYFYYPRKVHLNLYLLLLAPSTFCRKSTCTDIVGDYIREINPSLLLPESFTPEALYTILQKQPRGLIIWRELIQVKEFMFGSEYSKGLPAFLTDAYDYKQEIKRWTKGDGEIIVQDAVVSILAAGIASWFVKSLNEIDFQGGIWTRFLFIPAPDQEHRYRLPQKFELDLMIRGRLATLNNREEGEIVLDEIRPLMQSWGESHMEQSKLLDNVTLQATFLRLEVMLLKLAALFQLAEDGGVVVREPAFRDAERVIEFIKRRLPTFFQEEVQFTPRDKDMAKIEKYLKTKGPALKGNITRYTHIDAQQADRLLSQLEEEGRIRSVQGDIDKSKPGRRAVQYAYVNQ